MKKPRLLPVVMILTVAFALLCGAVFWLRGELLKKSEYSAQNRDYFTCYSYDPDGRRLEGHWSAEDELWYLFLTSTQSPEDTLLYASGGIEATSCGVLEENMGVVRGAFSQSGDRVTLTTADGEKHTVVALQSALPSVYIDLEGTTLQQIHADQTMKYDSTSVYITDPAGVYSLAVRNDVQIKGRGNSSWQVYDKKGYQIRFDTKTSVMGMPEAKKWVLLASAGDDSLMRFQLAARAAKSWDMDFVPEFRYVDLWIEGEYLGTYLLGEKVEIGENRLALGSADGALFEHDETFYLDEENWFLSDILNRHFSLKELAVEEDALIPATLKGFEGDLEELMAYLYSTPSEQVTMEDLSRRIDVDSFAKYYLINEYAQNNESFSTSFYWYKDGAEDVLHLGPIWDFDSCMGTDGQLPTASYGHEHPLFQYLLAAPVFYERTQQLMSRYGSSLHHMTEDAAVLAEQIQESAYMNYCRWNTLGKANPKGGPNLAPTYDAAVENLRAWLSARETGFQIYPAKAVSSTVSDDCRNLQLRVMPGIPCAQVIFSVWSYRDGQDDIRWYPAEQKEDGSWQVTVDLGYHNCDGLYYFDAYADGQTRLIADGRTYVEYAVEPKFPIEVAYSADGKSMYLHMTDVDGGLTSVRFAVWCPTDRDNTFLWQPTELVDGRWTGCMVSCVLNLSEPELVVVHAYGTDEAGEERLVSEEHIEITAPVPHTVGEDASICATCGRILK